MDGISKKIYLEMMPPTEEDSRSDQMRILESLREMGIEAHMGIEILRQLYPFCEQNEWKMTVSLSWDGMIWQITGLEEGDTSRKHYGYAVDLGSTTVVTRLMDCNTGENLGETSCFNRQIAYGMDILSRIFYSKDDAEKLEELRECTAASIRDCLTDLEKQTGIAPESCISMVVSGNTTMVHFLIGMDAFCVFYTPHAVRADQPGFIRGKDLEIPVPGYIYLYPAKSNYLGGDIISGMIATELYKKEEIRVFFDIGTNGELVIGNKDFLLCGAGAAGPALEGGVVKTGMRAANGAVDEVQIHDGEIRIHVIGESEPQGICGSGIVDLLAQLFLAGWIDIRGQFMENASPLIQKIDGRYAVEYAPGLFFYQEDIEEFIRTKAAAYTMVEIMMQESGISLDEVEAFYVAGAFGKHVSGESAVAIGMYPDMDREKIINAGNSSLDGAQKLLLDRSLVVDVVEILEKMVYVQFAAVDNFLDIMKAAQALPHTDFRKYPSVMKKVKLFK